MSCDLAYYNLSEGSHEVVVQAILSSYCHFSYLN